MTLLTPNKKTKPIKEYIADDIEDFLDFATLDKLPDDCPWKSYEGINETEFMQTLFAPLGKKHYFFQKIIPHVKDIAFVKVYAKAIKKEYWCALYLVGEDKNGEALFYFGGEPNLNPIMPSSITENSQWKEYPQFLKDIWAIHGFWFGDMEYAVDLQDIANLGEYQGGYDAIQHATKLQLMSTFANEYRGDNEDDLNEFYELA